MDVPLLSQDEFFRHLNLRSVHATSAKYHYRQALKERLRASSQAQSLGKLPVKKEPDSGLLKSPILSPAKWLTPKTCKQMFGRPKIRKEKRALDFDDDAKKPLFINSLLSNCHVLRHPGIRSEVQAKLQSGLKLEVQNDHHRQWHPKSSCILERLTYWKPSTICQKKRRRKRYQVHIRVQPVIIDDQSRAQLEHKMSAALALYHFYKPKRKNGDILSFEEFTKVFVTNFCHSNSKKPTKPKQMTSQPALNKPLEDSKPEEKDEVETIVKTAYGREVKPVIKKPAKKELVAPIIEKKLQQKEERPISTCLTSLPMLGDITKKLLRFTCDICHRQFDKRTRMIRHYKNVHSSDLHKVDLSKFVLSKKLNYQPLALIEL